MTATDLCRITISTPGRTLDVALPARTPLAQLLPVLLRVAGMHTNPAGAGGWVLQRVGEQAFPTGASLADLNVRDGEVLHLRPRETQLPETTFDDVADVISSGIRDRRRWGARETRAVGLGATATLLGIGLLALAVSGPQTMIRAIVAGVIAVVLVLIGSTLSRALRDSAPGTVLGFSSLPYGFLAGLLAPGGATGWGLLAPPNVLAAFAVAMVLAMISAFAMEGGLPTFLGTAVAAFIGVLSAAADLLFDLPAAGLAATAVAISMGFSALVPTLSFRLARLPLPALPSNAEELREDNSDVDAKTVLDRTAIADRFATGFIGSICMIALVAFGLMGLDRGGWAMWMSVVLSIVLLLRARTFRAKGQRLWLLLTGLTGLTMLGLGGAIGGDVTVMVVVVVPLTVVAALAVMAVGLWLPRGRPSPFWGRAADIVDMILLMGLMPLGLGVLGLYTMIQAMVG